MAVGSSTEDNSTKHFVLTSLASIISGGVARLICHPIDTIKAKLQVETQRVTVDKVGRGHIWQLVKSTVHNEGIRGLYPGIGIATIGSAPALALFFTSYEIFKHICAKNHILEDSFNLRNFFCGLGAEIVSCVMWVPIDVTKERLQVQSNLKSYNYKNTMDAISKIIGHEGWRGLYKAYGATLFSFGPFSGLYLMFYEKLKDIFHYQDKQIGFFPSLMLSTGAASSAGLITNALDMSKLRMQVQRAEKAMGETQARFGYKNVFHGVYSIYTKEGFLSLFKGSLARVLYHTPANAITMGLLETTRGMLYKLTGEKQEKTV